MDKLKLAKHISNKTTIPFYVAKYEIGNDTLGWSHSHEYSIFFKSDDIKNCNDEIITLMDNGFTFSPDKILEFTIKRFNEKSSDFSQVLKNEHGIIYKYLIQ